MATESGAHTLQSILTSFYGETRQSQKNGSEDYLRRVPKSEVISRPKGNNFVCVVNTIEEFYRDQSDFSNCQGISEHEKPRGKGGGYVYCPANGNLRLNFFEWGEWVEEQFRDDGNNLEKDWPVRW
ncbi:MAG: hypothetical protein H3C47_15115 [Candidatus Cloacimonetes bacterium]|nr:hypothetical protein [Candidatus Cloacimonadota bacterium]